MTIVEKKDDPSAQTAAAAYMAEERAMIATLMAGTGAMRAAGQKYLPKHPAESDDAYAYRKKVSTLYNGMRRTIGVLAGKPFSEPLDIGESMPPDVAAWCEDIDLQGRDLHAFAHTAFVQALADGLTHILVEYPQTQPGATLADKRATGARPYFLHVKHGQVLGWRSERIAGVETLTMLRLMETVSEPDGRFADKDIPQIRVLERDRWETWRKSEKDCAWIHYDEGVVTLGAIPLVTIYTGRDGFMQARPPLLDLAWLNIEHWQSSSDQTNILRVARVPILFGAGFEDGALKIGAGSGVTNDNTDAKLHYVEHSGAAIGAGRQEIKDLEERLSLMGAQLLVRRPGSKTATEKAIDSADADSELSVMVRTLEDSLEHALQFACDWESLGTAGEVELTGEIGGLEDMDVTSLLRCVELSILSRETVFGELQRRGLVSDDLSWKPGRDDADGPVMPGELDRLQLEAKDAALKASAPQFAPGLPNEVPGVPMRQAKY